MTRDLRTGLALVFAALAISGCSSTRSPAPVTDRRPQPEAARTPPVAPAAAAPAAGVAQSGSYVVKRSDTMFSIALEHGVDYRDLARWNSLDDPSKIQIGQSLRVSPPEGEGVQVGAARGSGAVSSRPLDGEQAAPAPAGAPGPNVKTEPKALRLPYSDQNLALLRQGDASVAPPRPEPVVARPAEAIKPAAGAEPKDPDAIEFIWPAKGRLIAGFSEPSSKGLDISGTAGDPVHAAAPGRVMYTGTGIRGYGKLIVIKHDNGFNSVYAHNREILVKEGQAVVRGQKIGEIGDTDADQVKLHFEIRKSGKPVDPMKYLPGDRPS
jgi:lipoprotein NlpD